MKPFRVSTTLSICRLLKRSSFSAATILSWFSAMRSSYFVRRSLGVFVSAILSRSFSLSSSRSRISSKSW